jgi:hypothetical protein
MNEVPMPSGMALKVSSVSAPLVQEAFRMNGAFVTGRRMFDIAHAWGRRASSSRIRRRRGG